MTRKRLDRAVRAFLGRLSALLPNKRGAIAPMTVLLMFPISLASFGALEYHRYLTLRSIVQDALDAASLTAAKSGSRDEAVLRQIAQSVLEAQIGFNADVRLTSLTVTTVNGVVVSDATIVVSPIVSNLISASELRITGHSEVTRESSPMEIALVLDTTWSMLTNDRIGIAKEAATAFVTKIGDAADKAVAGGGAPNRVRIGLVPFNSAVNVGSSYSGAAWMDTQGISPAGRQLFSPSPGFTAFTNGAQNGALQHLPSRFALLSQMGLTWRGCVEARPAPYDVSDAPATASEPNSLFVPYFAPDEPDEVDNAQTYNAGFTPVPVQTFGYPNSYLRDIRVAISGATNNGQLRLGSPWPTFAVADTPTIVNDFFTHAGNPGLYGGDNAQALQNGWKGVQGNVSKYSSTTLDLSNGKGPNRDCLADPIVPPTNSYSTVKTAIRSLSVNSSTNIPMGLMWGWHVVSPNSPYGGTRPYGAGNTKIVVLMTDGDNWLPGMEQAENKNGVEYSSVGYPWQNRLGTTSTDSVERSRALNSKMTTICTNMKAQNIIIYTVRVEVTGAPDLLRNCASDSGKFFDVQRAADLDDAFTKIAASIQTLRISR